jgi:hypothetical protein
VGKYYEALDTYEQVLGCFLWIEFKDLTKKEQIFSEFQSTGITDDDVVMKERQIVRECDR